MVSKKEFNNINKIVQKYDLGEIQEIDLLNSSQNQVYKVLTTKNTYVIKK